MFGEMTVRENLDWAPTSMASPAPRTNETVFGLFPILQERENQRAGLMSGGEQQMLALARADVAPGSTSRARASPQGRRHHHAARRHPEFAPRR